jgi:hypothetical protein
LTSKGNNGKIFYVIIPQTPIACQGFFFCWKMRKEDFQMDRVRFGQILAYGVEKIKNIGVQYGFRK